MGTGKIDGRRVVVGGDDFTVRGGAGDASIGGKQGHSERTARELRLPLVRLVEGTGGGGSVKSYETAGRTYVPGNPGLGPHRGVPVRDPGPVGVLANDPRHAGGALTAEGSEKLTRFVDLCDTFHLPVVNFVDQPGFLIGVRAERAGTVRKGVRALAAVYQATVPWVTVIVRRVFGVAGAGHANVQALNLRYAWPSGDWGSLPLEGGIEEIIDPRDTRPLLCDWVALAYVNEATRLGVKTRGMRP